MTRLIKRYNIVAAGQVGDTRVDLEEHPSGALVLYRDVEVDRAFVARATEVLRSLEWSASTVRFKGDENPCPCCPACRSVMREEGEHCDNCALDGLLRDLKDLVIP